MYLKNQTICLNSSNTQKENPFKQCSINWLWLFPLKLALFRNKETIYLFQTIKCHRKLRENTVFPNICHSTCGEERVEKWKIGKEREKEVELFSLKDQPCTWEMLENILAERIHIFVFALGCYLSTEKKWSFLTKDSGMLLKIFKSLSHRLGPLCKGGGREIRVFGDVEVKDCACSRPFSYGMQGSSLGAFCPCSSELSSVRVSCFSVSKMME